MKQKNGFPLTIRGNDKQAVLAGLVSGSICLLIKLYQITVSPFLGQHCRFYPSCSSFMCEAVDKTGWRGVLIGLKRLGRCHPFHPGGYDPVENWIPRTKS